MAANNIDNKIGATLFRVLFACAAFCAFLFAASRTLRETSAALARVPGESGGTIDIRCRRDGYSSAAAPRLTRAARNSPHHR